MAGLGCHDQSVHASDGNLFPKDLRPISVLPTSAEGRLVYDIRF